MGGIVNVMGCRRKTPEKIVYIAGQSDAGKTTILYKYKLGTNHPIETCHTTGYFQETIVHRGISFNMVDMGGGEKILPCWLRVFDNASVLIFVIDSTDTMCISTSDYYLRSWIENLEKNQLVVLIFANKQDLPNAMTVEELTDKMNLKSLRIPWHIQPASAINGEGINEGLDWLCQTIWNTENGESLN
ncbi:hypothetical protein PPYR_12916 [Photinus pyralis]|nr:ADP-ribosylation factor 1-like [Photinus pyralis]KAB0793296.1 hypothetical protein PPYR_12916 [Photinus pyralis]